MKTGLFFGSFNPVHIGHLAIANYISEFTEVKEIWFVLSPHNPLKEKLSLLPEHDRKFLLEIAIGDDPRFKISDVEFKLPQPSFTIDTLTYLKERYPTREFMIIMGADGLDSFDKWKNYETIIKQYHRIILSRPGCDIEKLPFKENSTYIDAPQMEISSTFIRKAIKENKDIRHFLPHGVYEYILKSHLIQQIKKS